MECVVVPGLPHHVTQRGNRNLLDFVVFTQLHATEVPGQQRPDFSVYPFIV